MVEASDWPVLRRYERDHLARIAMPLGGIGTGTVSLGGRGDLRDWEVVNRPAKGFAPEQAGLVLRARPHGGEPVARALEGPLDPSEYDGSHGSRAANHGLPRFRDCAFEAAYPLGQVLLSDPAVPVAVRLQAFNPLIPGDTDRSGMPVAILRLLVANRADAPVDVALCASVVNFVGTDGTDGAPSGNRNEPRRGDRLTGLLLRSDGVDPRSEQWGTLALALTGPAPGRVSHRTAWADLSWGDSLLDFWDDLLADGRLEDRPAGGAERPVASLCTDATVPAGGSTSATFLLAWHFPNRRAWGAAADERVGNHYATRYADAWAAAEEAAERLSALEADTVAFVRAFCAADLPDEVKEAALCNLSTLRTQTCFRTEDGRFYGWEGYGDRAGCCMGSCTHVWNYEQATAFLFGDLARSMREVEFAHATDGQGRMSFRVQLPLARAREWGLAAADGQMGCVMKLYRDWRLSGDKAFLRALWPAARRALEFAWIPGGWDADRDGVMEGCQHNTMDVEYYGPNPQMAGWYLGALRAGEEMAHHLGEDDFAADCRRLFESGSAWVDAHLFNGEYYEHEVRPPGRDAAIAEGLRHPSMGGRDLDDPALQLGAGCLVDQLVGQLMAHVCGLGHLLAPEHVQATLASVMRHNFRPDLHAHFNHLRTFALQEEAALLMCAYPRGRRPRRPFPYFNEVMTGFEYTAAAHMLYEGRIEDGLACIRAVRARYDGRRRNPFDEAECGHHYARAMASWAAVLALSGFAYDGVDASLTLAATGPPSTQFWSNGAAWGSCAQRQAGDHVDLRLSVLGGRLRLRRLVLTGAGALDLPATATIAGATETFRVPRAPA